MPIQILEGILGLTRQGVNLSQTLRNRELNAGADDPHMPLLLMLPHCQHSPVLAEPLAGPSPEPCFLLLAAPLTRAANFFWQIRLLLVALWGHVAPRTLTSSLLHFSLLCQLITALSLLHRGIPSGLGSVRSTGTTLGDVAPSHRSLLPAKSFAYLSGYLLPKSTFASYFYPSCFLLLMGPVCSHWKRMFSPSTLWLLHIHKHSPLSWAVLR